MERLRVRETTVSVEELERRSVEEELHCPGQGDYSTEYFLRALGIDAAEVAKGMLERAAESGPELEKALRRANAKYRG